MHNRGKVVVAMSGGVDSSVAAALLVDQGYEVLGMMLRLWSEPGSEQSNRCCAPDAMALARRVASHLKIPFYVLDSRQIFHDKVVNFFIDGYSRGITPNPCLVCNQQIRWGYLLNHALSINADFFATGHYAKLHKDEAGNVRLMRAADHRKDQSYVLHGLTQQQLQATLLPLGSLTKDEVRRLAREFALPVSERAESQDLCFLGNDTYHSFLKRNHPEIQKPGLIVDHIGNVLGHHQGLAFYTIGQRKGLGLSSPQPLFVLDKHLEENILIVGTKQELGTDILLADNINWISGNPPVGPFTSQVKIRYKAPFAQALVTPIGIDRARVVFDQSLLDITPGQAAVFYDQEVCLGGGFIQPMSTKTSLLSQRSHQDQSFTKA
jgi:tRNA-uridine 2-sulfurtransferase